MPSLLELVERVNKGESVDPGQLELYQESSNSAERFLSNHAGALLELRHAQQMMLHSLEAIDYSDQKVLGQYLSICGFLGLSEHRHGPMLRFGSCAIARREYALGLEAIQQAGAFVHDHDGQAQIASLYDRVAGAVSLGTTDSIDHNNRQTRIAYVTSGIDDADASARTIAGFARHLDGKRFKLMVYGTEATVRRERQQFNLGSTTAPSTRRGMHTLETLGQKKIPAWLAPLDGDLTTAAKELAQQMLCDRIDVILFDTLPYDAVASLVANWQVAREKVCLARRGMLLAGGIRRAVLVDQDRSSAIAESLRQRGVETTIVPEGIDVDDLPAVTVNRAGYGIPDSAVVLATSATNAEQSLSDSFVDTVINILRAHPQAVYLVVGDGELSKQRRRFDAAGIGKRVGYAGKRKDLPGFLKIADIYLAEFPQACTRGVLHAMAMEKPVVVAADDTQSTAICGEESSVAAGDSGAYIERVSRLIRDTAYRAKLAKSGAARVAEQFSMAHTVRQFEQLLGGTNAVSDSGSTQIGGSLAEAA